APPGEPHAEGQRRSHRAAPARDEHVGRDVDYELIAVEAKAVVNRPHEGKQRKDQAPEKRRRVERILSRHLLKADQEPRRAISVLNSGWCIPHDLAQHEVVTEGDLAKYEQRLVVDAKSRLSVAPAGVNLVEAGVVTYPEGVARKPSLGFDLLTAAE